MDNTDARRLARNTGLLYVRMIAVMLASLYATRVVLRTLGFEDYGLYNVIGNVVVFFGFLEAALTSATSRYISFELGRGDEGDVSRILSMAINCHIILAAALWIILEAAGLWIINTKLNIDQDRLRAANWLFQFTLLTFCFRIIQMPLHSNIIAHERMGFYAAISITEAVLKLVAALILVCFNGDKLVVYGILLFSVQLFVLLLYVLANKLFIKDTRYIKSWDTGIVKQFAAYSGWSLLVSGTDITTQQCTGIFFKIFLTSVANAALGVASQVNSAIIMFISSFTQSYKPQIVKSYAAGDYDYFSRLLFSASKVSFVLYLVIAVPIVANADYILRLWLGDYPPLTPALIAVILLYRMFDSFQEPLWSAVHATGRIRTHQILMASIKILAIPGMFFMLKSGRGAVAAMSVWALLNVVCAVVRTIYMHYLVNMDLKAYFKDVIARILLLFIVVVPATFAVSHSMGNSLAGFLLSSSVSVLLTVALSLFYVLDKDERKLLSFIPVIGKYLE